MQNRNEKQYFLKLWGWKLRRAIHEVRKAYILLSWYAEHVVWEYVLGDGRRYGRVAWSSQITDVGCAASISGDGVPCTARIVRGWRKVLKRRGYVTWRRTPGGLIIFVLESEKFPAGHDRLKEALATDERLISEAFLVRDRIAGMVGGTRGERMTKPSGHTDQIGLSSDQIGLSGDQIGLSNIRDEVANEV